jgi:hypothetical protein
MNAISSMGSVAWTADHWEVFPRAAREWTPPASVRCAVNSVRDRVTFVAWFTRPDGVRVKATTVATPNPRSGWGIEEDHLDVRLGGGSRQ